MLTHIICMCKCSIIRVYILTSWIGWLGGHTHNHTHTHSCTHAHMHMNTHTHAHTHIYICMHMHYMQYVHIAILAHIWRLLYCCFLQQNLHLRSTLTSASGCLMNLRLGQWPSHAHCLRPGVQTEIAGGLRTANASSAAVGIVFCTSLLACVVAGCSYASGFVASIINVKESR